MIQSIPNNTTLRPSCRRSHVYLSFRSAYGWFCISANPHLVISWSNNKDLQILTTLLSNLFLSEQYRNEWARSLFHLQRVFHCYPRSWLIDPSFTRATMLHRIDHGCPGQVATIKCEKYLPTVDGKLAQLHPISPFASISANVSVCMLGVGYPWFCARVSLCLPVMMLPATFTKQIIHLHLFVSSSDDRWDCGIGFGILTTIRLTFSFPITELSFSIKSNLAWLAFWVYPWWLVVYFCSINLFLVCWLYKALLKTNNKSRLPTKFIRRGNFVCQT